MKTPKPIQNLIDSFEKLPGIGPKSAQRLTFYLLHVPQHNLDQFADALKSLKEQTKMCAICKNVDETDPCSICSDSFRDTSVICVVEDPLDVLALERTRNFKWSYHVLHGAINPLNNIGPDEIFISHLLMRLGGDSPVEEIILATNPTMEGEATAMYIQKAVRNLKGESIKITRIGRGLPIGSDLEYADEITLERALEGRREY